MRPTGYRLLGSGSCCILWESKTELTPVNSATIPNYTGVLSSPTIRESFLPPLSPLCAALLEALWDLFSW
jgi:hypothetical protein